MNQQQNAAPQTQALTPYQQRAIELREQIASAEPTAIVPRTFAEAQSFASALAASNLVPQDLRDNAPNVLMMLLAGAELGLAPVASLRVFHVIEGVPKLSADGIAALCMRSPLCEYLEPRVQTSERVVWATKRCDRPSEVTLEITQEDVERAGLTKPTRSGAPSNHVKYPRAMKNARCKAELCRMVYPEICAGLLSAEEARDVQAIDAEYVEIKTNLAPLPALPTKSADPVETRQIDTTRLDPPTEAQAADKSTEPTPSNEPLSEDDVLLLIADMKEAARRGEPRELAQIAADISKMNITEAQRKTLLKEWQACSAEARKAKKP